MYNKLNKVGMDDKSFERATEIIKVFKQLRDLELGDGFEEINNFRDICNKFIRDGKDVKGRIPIAGTKRIICYDLNSQKVDCMLKFSDLV